MNHTSYKIWAIICLACLIIPSGLAFDRVISYIGIGVIDPATGNVWDGIKNVTSRIYYDPSGGFSQHTETTDVNITNGNFVITINYTVDDVWQPFYIEPEVVNKKYARFLYTPAAQAVISNETITSAVGGVINDLSNTDGYMNITNGTSAIINVNLTPFDLRYLSAYNITGIGVANKIAFWYNTTELRNSSIYTNGSHLGINDISPDAMVDINLETADTIGLIIQGIANQVGSLFDVRSNIPDIYAEINGTGTFFYNSSEICTAKNGLCNSTGTSSSGGGGGNVTSIIVSGTTTKTLQLNQTNGTTILNASWTDIDTNDTTIVTQIVATNCTGQVVAGFYANGTGYCEADDVGSGADGTGGWTNTSTTTSTALKVVTNGSAVVSYPLGVPLVARKSSNTTAGTAPDGVSNLYAWWKADSIQGVSDGGSVTQWNDSGGGGYTLSPLSTAPKYNATGTYSGKPYVKFAAGGPMRNLSVNVPGPYTMVFVAKINPAYFDLLMSDGTGASRILTNWYSNQVWYITSNYTYGYCGSGTDAYPGGWVVGWVLMNGTLVFSINGNTDVSCAAAYGSGNISGGIYLAGNSGGYGIIGGVAEFAVYSRNLTLAELHSVEDYLGQKYGIELADDAQTQDVFQAQDSSNQSLFGVKADGSIALTPPKLSSNALTIGLKTDDYPRIVHRYNTISFGSGTSSVDTASWLMGGSSTGITFYPTGSGSGDVQIRTTGDAGFAFTPGSGGKFTMNDIIGYHIEPVLAGYRALVVLPLTGQEGQLGYFGAATGTNGLAIDKNANLLIGGVTNRTITADAMLEVNAKSSTSIPVIIQGAAAQSANLTQWQNSAGAVLASVNASGSLFVESGNQVCTAANGLCGTTGVTSNLTILDSDSSICWQNFANGLLTSTNCTTG